MIETETEGFERLHGHQMEELKTSAIGVAALNEIRQRREALSKIESNIQMLYATLGASPGTCKACGAAIWWVKTKNGKNAPFTAAGLNHFADCPKAKNFRKAAKGAGS